MNYYTRARTRTHTHARAREGDLPEDPSLQRSAVKGGPHLHEPRQTMTPKEHDGSPTHDPQPPERQQWSRLGPHMRPLSFPVLVLCPSWGYTFAVGPGFVSLN